MSNLHNDELVYMPQELQHLWELFLLILGMQLSFNKVLGI